MTLLIDHREQSDRYQCEAFRKDGLRVILCKDGIQWILQRQDKLAGARWRALGYPRDPRGADPPLDRLKPRHST